MHLETKKRIGKAIAVARLVADALEDAARSDLKKAELYRRCEEYADTLRRVIADLEANVGAGTRTVFERDQQRGKP